MAKKYFIFSDSDLDGICSYITLSWFLTGEPNIPYKLTTVSKFRQDLEQWLKTDSFANYDKVFILDMDISNDAHLVDRTKVVVIDHHKTHVAQLGKYDKAKTIVKEYSSATKLIYTQFQKAKELTVPQKTLIALANDYDSYALKVPQSYDLHVVYYQTQNSTDKTRAAKFIESFGQGFTGFTEQQQNLADLHRATVRKTINSLVIYGGKMIIQDKSVEVRSTVCERAINEVADYLIKELKADIAIVINPSSGHVSFRRRAESADVDVSELAERFCEGGGHAYAAGGKVTEKFLELTKLFKQLS